MLWFFLGFVVVVGVGTGYHRFTEGRRLPRSRETLLKEAERAVYDSRSETEYHRALQHLMEVTSEVDESQTSRYGTDEPSQKRATD